MKTVLVVLLLALSGCANVKHQSFNKLTSVLDETYPIWKINDSLVNTNGAISIYFSETHPDEIRIPHWKKVLNGSSHGLLACHGEILAEGDPGFVVGTSVEGPTHGTLRIYDSQCRLVGSTDCQKVVRMKLVDLLNDGVKEIVTWEDHHYGTCTTRRQLNVYKIDATQQPHRVFARDLVDATFMPGGPNGVKRKLHYTIDIDSKAPQKQIVVTSDKGQVWLYSWTGTEYKTANKAIDRDKK